MKGLGGLFVESARGGYLCMLFEVVALMSDTRSFFER